jgi:transposase-like protein
MTTHVFVFLLVSFLMLCLFGLWSLCWPHHGPAQSRAAAKLRPKLHRHLSPRCPHDCPACCLASTASSGGGLVPLPVRPWREVKSRRGAPKRINTEGFACPNPQCPYFGITDASIHALVGDGTHGCAEQIQTFRCQACHATFSARHDTPLYRLKTPSQQVARVLSALAEGLDPSAAERVFGYRQATITTWLTRAARACSDLARALLPPSLAPAPATGRTAHPAALCQAGALALAGYRPLHKDSSRALSGSPYPTYGTPAHPLPATDAGSWLPPALYQ